MHCEDGAGRCISADPSPVSSFRVGGKSSVYFGRDYWTTVRYFVTVWHEMILVERKKLLQLSEAAIQSVSLRTFRKDFFFCHVQGFRVVRYVIGLSQEAGGHRILDDCTNLHSASIVFSAKVQSFQQLTPSKVRYCAYCSKCTLTSPAQLLW